MLQLPGRTGMQMLRSNGIMIKKAAEGRQMVSDHLKIPRHCYRQCHFRQFKPNQKR